MNENFPFHPPTPFLTDLQRIQIADTLEECANQVASYADSVRNTAPRPVIVALHRELRRHRKLAAAIRPPVPEETFEDEKDK